MNAPMNLPATAGAIASTSTPCWYVTVALQRIHGISPDRVRVLREKVRKTATSIKAAPIDTHTPMRMPSTSSSLSPIQDRWRPSTGMGSLKEQIRMLAASKSMR